MDFFYIKTEIIYCEVIKILNLIIHIKRKKRPPIPKQKELSLFSVIPLRFERRTHALEGRCSIQLSYGTILVIVKLL